MDDARILSNSEFDELLRTEAASFENYLPKWDKRESETAARSCPAGR